MKSVKEFNDLMESKFTEIEDDIQEKERQRKEAHKKFAESCISLLSSSVKQISPNQKYAYITKRDPVLGDYRVGNNGEAGRSPSQVLLKDNFVRIDLFYAEDAKLGRPEHFDLELVNSLLEPYFVKVTIDSELGNGESMLVIEYNRNLRIANDVTDRLEEKEKKAKAEEIRRRQEAASKNAIAETYQLPDFLESDLSFFGPGLK